MARGSTRSYIGKQKRQAGAGRISIRRKSSR